MAEDIQIRGAAELQRALTELPAKLEKNILRGALRAGAKVLEQEAKALTPVDDGKLRASVRVSAGAKKNGVVYAHVKAGDRKKGGAWYAALVEFGTRPHIIRADRAKGGRAAARSIRTANNYIKRGFLKIGEAFVSAVRHPGSRPAKFMSGAVDNKSRAAVDAIAAYIRTRLEREAKAK